jgi:IS605 OrfB family transposase
MVRAVNLVWNYCGGAQEHARRWNMRWPSGFDLINLTSGVSRDLGLHSDTVQAVCKQFAVSRDKAKRRPRWRWRKSLGWVPFQAARAIKISDGAAWFLGRKYRLWFSRPVEGKIKSGCFAQDARGRWHLNLQVEVGAVECEATGEVGIDLGLATLATLSTGEKIENPRHVRRHEEALAKAQRAGNKRRAKAIHAKIANCRRHHLHEVTTRLVRAHRRIVVGNVSAAKLARTRMAKSVLDAGWSKLRGMLRYKAMMLGAEYVEVDERYSSQDCSACGTRGGPKGREALSVRSWVCSACGVEHDRDHNASKNILASGRNVGLHLPEILGL